MNSKANKKNINTVSWIKRFQYDYKEEIQYTFFFKKLLSSNMLKHLKVFNQTFSYFCQ